MIKKFIKYSLLTTFIIWFFSSICFWGDSSFDFKFPYESEEISDNVINCDWKTDLWNCTSIKEDERWSSDTILRRLLWVFGLKQDKNDDLKFIDYARAILNMALGLVALIALIMTIYTFYMMFFSENEAGAKKAKWNLVGIFIALGIIWLAWLIVSFIFWRYQANWKQHENDIETWDVAEVWEFYYE